MMTARPMHVAVAHLVGRGGANRGDLHLEVERYPRQRMVAIKQHLSVGHFAYRDDTLVTGLELHAGFYFLSIEPLQGHALKEVLVEIAVAHVGRNDSGELFTGLPAFHLLFKTRHDLMRPLNVREGVPARGGIQCFSLVVAQCVMETDYGVVGNGHA